MSLLRKIIVGSISAMVIFGAANAGREVIDETVYTDYNDKIKSMMTYLDYCVDVFSAAKSMGFDWVRSEISGTPVLLKVSVYVTASSSVQTSYGDKDFGPSEENDLISIWIDKIYSDSRDVLEEFNDYRGALIEGNRTISVPDGQSVEDSWNLVNSIMVHMQNRAANIEMRAEELVGLSPEEIRSQYCQ